MDSFKTLCSKNTTTYTYIPISSYTTTYKTSDIHQRWSNASMRYLHTSRCNRRWREYRGKEKDSRSAGSVSVMADEFSGTWPWIMPLVQTFYIIYFSLSSLSLFHYNTRYIRSFLCFVPLRKLALQLFFRPTDQLHIGQLSTIPKCNGRVIS